MTTEWPDDRMNQGGPNGADQEPASYPRSGITIDVQVCESAVLAPAAADSLAHFISEAADRALLAADRASATSSKTTGCITIRLIGREESAILNANWRGKDYATNVLSFPYVVDEPSDSVELPSFPEALSPDERPIGDLAICVPVVAEEAREQGKSMDDHYAHMVVHGVLHLMGYDHIRDDEAHRMESLEADVLKGIGIADPYQHPLDNIDRQSEPCV